MPHPLPIFYRPEQSVRGNASFSPSAGKPAKVIADWHRNRTTAPLIDVRTFKPVTEADIAAVHDARYVADVLACRRDNGFRNRSLAVAASLPYTVGSMVAAAEHAARHRENTCSPTSGFHHARFAGAAGFCTFNGLLVAANRVLRAGLVEKVGILDMDYHYGDGTDDILGVNAYLRERVVHATSGAVDLGPRSPDQDDHFKASRWVLRALRDMHRAGCGLVLYQAGADMHCDDPLGGLLNDHAMTQRDAHVFSWAEKHSLPVAWNLAGGYRKTPAGAITPVLKTHRQTLLASVGHPSVFTPRYLPALDG